MSYRKWCFRTRYQERDRYLSLLWVEWVALHPGPPSAWGGFTSTTPNGKANHHHCQAPHLFAWQTGTSLLQAPTPASFRHFVTDFPRYRVWLDSDQRPTCKRLKTEGGSVLLEIYLAIRWKTWLQEKKKALDTRKRWESQSWIKVVLIFNINESVTKGLYMSHANFYVDENCNEMVSQSL